MAESLSAAAFRASDNLQRIVDYLRKIAKHAEALPPATAATSDCYVGIQSLTDDVDVSADLLRKQCQHCLEGLAAVQGLSCPDSLMDDLISRMFSTSSERMDAEPTVATINSTEAMDTKAYLSGLVSSRTPSSIAEAEPALLREAEADAHARLARLPCPLSNSRYAPRTPGAWPSSPRVIAADSRPPRRQTAART